MDDPLAVLRASLAALDEETAVRVTHELIDGGRPPREILQEGLAASMLEIGRRWNAGDMYLPEVVAAAEIFKRCNDLVEPALLASGEEILGHRVVTATVKGDLHDLGKNMVGAMLKTAGFEVIDLGKDVSAEAIVGSVRDLHPTLLGLSSLLTTTVPEQRAVIRALEDAGLRGSVGVMVGGAPVTQEWAEEIGADGFAPDAPEAVQLALRLVGDDRPQAAP